MASDEEKQDDESLNTGGLSLEGDGESEDITPQAPENRDGQQEHTVPDDTLQQPSSSSSSEEVKVTEPEDDDIDLPDESIMDDLSDLDDFDDDLDDMVGQDDGGIDEIDDEASYALAQLKNVKGIKKYILPATAIAVVGGAAAFFMMGGSGEGDKVQPVLSNVEITQAQTASPQTSMDEQLSALEFSEPASVSDSGAIIDGTGEPGSSEIPDEVLNDMIGYVPQPDPLEGIESWPLQDDMYLEQLEGDVPRAPVEVTSDEVAADDDLDILELSDEQSERIFPEEDVLTSLESIGQAEAMRGEDSTEEVGGTETGVSLADMDDGFFEEVEALGEDDKTTEPKSAGEDVGAPRVYKGGDFGETAVKTVRVPTVSSGAPKTDDVYYDSMAADTEETTIGELTFDLKRSPAEKIILVKKVYEQKDREALLVSANRAVKLQRYEAALDLFDQLYDKNDRDPRVLMGRAVVLQKVGQDAAALMMYEALLDIDPENKGAMLNMLVLLKEQYPAVAIRRLISLHERYPLDAAIVAQVGITQAEMGYDNDARRFLEIAVSLEPKNAQHMYNLAIIADRSGDKDGAIKLYKDALELDAVYGGSRTIPRKEIYSRVSTLRRR